MNAHNSQPVPKRLCECRVFDGWEDTDPCEQTAEFIIKGKAYCFDCAIRVCPRELIESVQEHTQRETLERVDIIACDHNCVIGYGLCDCSTQIARAIKREFAPKGDE